jgi:hypothetical protein
MEKSLTTLVFCDVKRINDGLGYSSSSAATHLLTELVTCPIETEDDGAVILRR